MTLQLALKTLFKKHSRNSGNYVPDYKYDELAEEIRKMKDFLEDAKTIAEPFDLEWEVTQEYYKLIQKGHTPEYAYTMALEEWDL